MRLYFSLLLLPAILLLLSCNNDTGSGDQSTATTPPPPIPSINYSVAAYLPHDTSLFTEGFLIHNGQLYESTGSPEDLPDAESLVGPIDPHTGRMDVKIRLDKEKYFGEGIAFLNGKLFQLTYLNQKGFIYDAATFKRTGEFDFASKQGWGLTTDGSHLIMDDGTDVLTFLEPVSLKTVKTLKVTINGAPRDSLNELEYIKGYIYANVWYADVILKIDPATGKVVGRLDLSSIVADARNKNPRANVLNGIAYDPVTDKIYVVGKQWPNIYQIDFPH